jgi:hypothetical protein
MSAETNRTTMRRFVEFINTASDTLAEELISPDAIFHIPGRSEPMRGPAGYLAVIGMMRSGFPDIQWTLEEKLLKTTWSLPASLCGVRIVASSLAYLPSSRDNWCNAQRSCQFGGPTGKIIAVQALNFYRLPGGQFIEERGQPDLLGLLQQIGAVPTPSVD